MIPIVIIGPGTSRLRYQVDSSRRVIVTCPSCGAMAIAAEAGTRRGYRHVSAAVEHDRNCAWLASVERSAGKGGRK